MDYGDIYVILLLKTEQKGGVLLRHPFVASFFVISWSATKGIDGEKV